MDMNALMRQAQAMQRQMMKAQRELEAKLFELVDEKGYAILNMDEVRFYHLVKDKIKLYFF